MKQGKILTIWSPVSGVGSSFTAINLCKLLNKNNQKTILVDLDVLTPSLHFYLDITNKENKNLDTIFTFIRGNNLTEETLDNNIIKDKDIFWIKGISSPENFNTVKEEIDILINKLKETYDYVIIDTHSGIFNFATYIALDIADKIFTVLERNVLLVKQYKRVQNVLIENKFHNMDKFALILNKSFKTIYIENEDISNFIGIKEVYELPKIEDKLINAINQGDFLDFINNKSIMKKYNENINKIISNL